VKTNIPPKETGKAVLVLEDGSIFAGYGFGAAKKVTGECVFSTSMVGYPESLTDPSYKGQILSFTYPLVGNYGVPTYDQELGVLKYFESDDIKVTGFVVHELCKHPFHWASTRTLDQWLKDEDVPGIYGIDTRQLTKKLRVKGVMLGILKVCEADEEPDMQKLLKEVKNVQDPNFTDLAKQVTVKEPIRYEAVGNKLAVVIDCGIKYGILRNLLRRGFNVVRVPHDYSAEQILDFKPDGVMISNGPGDPKQCVKTVEAVRELLDRDMPMMGVCLGTQILALAVGGDTYKLKYGHRSQNQPALDLETGRCYITTQNHGYTVQRDSLKDTGLTEWFMNVNDKTVEGVKHETKPAFALQWHPEASPGPYDTEFLFDRFRKLAEAR
jgi:carbamoyl-phosphate synthase small subunit